MTDPRCRRWGVVFLNGVALPLTDVEFTTAREPRWCPGCLGRIHGKGGRFYCGAACRAADRRALRRRVGHG